jgi:hypothetical protein
LTIEGLVSSIAILPDPIRCTQAVARLDAFAASFLVAPNLLAFAAGFRHEGR